MAWNKAYGMIGMAMKAGKLASGEFATEKAVKSGLARVVLVAGDASDNTKKMFTNMCVYYKVPVYIYSDKEMLGAAIGRQYRASLAITDEGFAKAMMKEIEQVGSEMTQQAASGRRKVWQKSKSVN